MSTPAPDPARGTPSQEPTGHRVEQGDIAGSSKHPPHVTENAENAPLQENQPAPGDVPVTPANAQGEDAIPTTELEQGIDEESMYDRRPSEHKDRPPSSPKTP